MAKTLYLSTEAEKMLKLILETRLLASGVKPTDVPKLSPGLRQEYEEMQNILFQLNLPEPPATKPGSKKKRLAIDVDGVLNPYTIPFSQMKGSGLEPMLPGTVEQLCEYVKHFEVYIFSTRCDPARPEKILTVSAWLLSGGVPREVVDQLIFTNVKQPVWLTLDDRAVQFKGTWPTVEEIEAFKPWNR